VIDNQNMTRTSALVEWPRPVHEIRDELVKLAQDACTSGDAVDAGCLDLLADELAWAASIARLYGGDATATEEFAAAVCETAELARLVAAHRRMLAA
jgi:hypothetical protein